MAAAPLHLPELGADASREYRLGIMGGTFDPIHYGHLVTAEQAREALELDLVLFMPAGRPAFKLDEDVSDAEDRYAMTILATAANSAFDASRFEIDREGVTYTIDTLRALRAYYPITSSSSSSPVLTRSWTLPRGTMPKEWQSSPRSSPRRDRATISIRLARGLRTPASPLTSATSRFPHSPSAQRTFASA